MKLQRTLLVILLLCLALPSLAAAEQDDFAVEPLEDGGVAITRYRGKVHKLTVPDTLDGQTVTAVRAGAFCDLDVLESVALPDSIVTVEDGAFSRCERLASIYVSPNHPALAAIDGVLFSKSDKRLICYPPAKEGGEYAVPQGIRAIGGGAFEGAARLKSVSIPDSVTEIGDYAFYGCPALDDLTLPDGLTTICEGAFAECAALTALTLPESVCEIGKDAFTDCPVTLTVERDSPAAQYAESARVPYTYPNANDWLND